MRVRRLVASVAAAVILAGAAAMAAPPASAASASVTCDADKTIEFTLEPGEVLTLDLSNCTGVTLTGTFDTTYFAAAMSVALADTTIPLAPAGGGGMTGYSGSPVLGVSFTAPGSEQALATQFFMTGETASVTVRVRVQKAGSTRIPDWVQGYGRGAATDACSAGWSPSWEMWMNGGKGGFVCTRSIPSLG